MIPSSRSHERELPFTGDPIAVGAALAADHREPFIVYEHPEAVCWAEGERARVTLTALGTELVVDGQRHDVPAGRDPVDGVRRALALLPFPGWRAYGWATYELCDLLSGRRGRPEPVLHLMVPQREIRFRPGSVLLRAADEADLDTMRGRLDTAVLRAQAETVGNRLDVQPDTDEHDAADYTKAVAEAIGSIGAGRLDKVVMSRAVPVPGDLDLAATYRAGRAGNNPARSFLLSLGGWEAAGYSPEIVVRVTADRRVATQPLAGTRAVLGDAAADAARGRELYRDAKEVFEHAISVRVSADRMAAVCRPGTVRVDDFMAVEQRGSVQHLASRLSGDLADGMSSFDALAALFPAVTASGIPLAEACDFIAETEPGDRGLYSGVVLMADADGSLDAALVLRTVFRRAGQTWLRAGAGVVAQSDPERELQETREKLRSVSRFLVPAVSPTAGGTGW